MLSVVAALGCTAGPGSDARDAVADATPDVPRSLLDGPAPADARPSPADARADAHPDATADADLCTEAVCAVGSACDPATGLCEPRAPRGGPAGPCAEARECPDGVCEVGVAWPGGFCAMSCDDCGPGTACDEAAERCVQRCGADRPCRGGWSCLATLEPDLDVCRPDCRAVGCAAGACNAETGACEACRYPCAPGEVCTDGHCLRRDKTCSTTYHCRAGEDRCDRGRCRRVEFAPCGDGCGELVCVEGRCRFPCGPEAACPAHRVCEDGVCAWQGCEVPTAACDLDGPGTCLALPAPAPEPGVCVQAGEVPTGAPCDEVSEACESGALCFGDPDDPLDPDPPDGRGVCRRTCHPDGAGPCDEARCVRLGVRPLGLCLPTDCSVSANDCGAGQHCRPYSLHDDAGRCGAAGRLREGCTGDDDCQDQAICVSRGDATLCLPLCVADEDCPNQSCFLDEGWAFGVCL